MSPAVESAVRLVVRLLVEKRYKDLETLSGGTRLSAREIEQAVQEYGGTLTYPPEDAFRLVDVIALEGVSHSQWSVIVPLWTEQEGRSDLSLEMTVGEKPEGTRIQLDNIHVR